MRLRIPKPMYFIAFAGMALFMDSCAKNTTIIYGNGEDNLPETPQKETTLVTFNASVESRNLTRAMSPMKKGIKSTLYAYQKAQSTTSQETLFAEGLYITSSPGVLSGKDGYKMYLANGIYNFYAVSDNFSTIPPSFTGQESEPLFNGIDYLWWGSTDQDVSSAQINIPIVFQHACTQVVVEVSAGDGIQLSRLLSATITPPVPGASMTLSTGVIPPATSYDKPNKMGINGFLAQYIMLPLQTNDPMTLTLEVETDGNNNSKTYSVQIPVPSGELKAGDSYLFSAVINGSSVSIPSVSVKDWTEVDETGNPLYPSQK